MEMDRVISPEERIKRAEEIYYKRRAQGVRFNATTVNVSSGRRVSFGKKMMIQVLVCVAIYSTFCLLKNHNNIFSERVISQTKEVLSYDINMPKMYNQCAEYFENKFNSIKKVKDENQEEIKDEKTKLEKDENQEEQENNVEQDNINQQEINNQTEESKVEESQLLEGRK